MLAPAELCRFDYHFANTTLSSAYLSVDFAASQLHSNVPVDACGKNGL